MPQMHPTHTLGSSERPAVSRQPGSRARRPPIAVDARLRARFRDGDPSAFRVVYSAYGRLVHAIAYSVLVERGLSEEATQQTFVKAWLSAGSVDPRRELGPWLATIARRVSIDIYRRETRRTARPLEAVPADDPALVSSVGAVEDTSDVWEVRRAVSLLPVVEQKVVRAQHFEGLTHEQIAGRLGIPVGTVKSRSFRAHQRLASELGHLRQWDQTCRCA